MRIRKATLDGDVRVNSVMAPYRAAQKRDLAAQQRGKTNTNLRALAVSGDSKNPDKPLTEMQRQFVKYHASGMNVTQSLLAAGFKNAQGTHSRITNHPAVQKALAIERQKYEEASQMSRKKVVDGLLEAIEMAKLVSEPSSMVAGWREIAKLCGYYAPVTKHVAISLSAQGFESRLKQLSDDELAKLAQGETIEGEIVTVEDGNSAEDDEDEAQAA